MVLASLNILYQIQRRGQNQSAYSGCVLRPCHQQEPILYKLYMRRDNPPSGGKFVQPVRDYTIQLREKGCTDAGPDL